MAIKQTQENKGNKETQGNKKNTRKRKKHKEAQKHKEPQEIISNQNRTPGNPRKKKERETLFKKRTTRKNMRGNKITKNK